MEIQRSQIDLWPLQQQENGSDQRRTGRLWSLQRICGYVLRRAWISPREKLPSTLTTQEFNERSHNTSIGSSLPRRWLLLTRPRRHQQLGDTSMADRARGREDLQRYQRTVTTAQSWSKDKKVWEQVCWLDGTGHDTTEGKYRREITTKGAQLMGQRDRRRVWCWHDEVRVWFWFEQGQTERAGESSDDRRK